MLLGKWHRQTCHKPAICFKKRVQYLWRTMKRIAIKRSVPVLAGKHSFVQTILQVGRDVFNTSSCEDGSHVLGMAEKKARRRRLDADSTAVPSQQPSTPCIQPSWYVSNKLILFKLLLWGRGFSFPKHLEQFLHNINVMQQNIQLEMKLFEWFLL